MGRTIKIAIAIAAVAALACCYLQGAPTRHIVFTPTHLDLGRVVLHVVPGQSYFPQAGGCESPNAAGCAQMLADGAHVWIVGYQTDKGLAVRHGVLIHELLHIGNWVSLSIAFPDEGEP